MEDDDEFGDLYTDLLLPFQPSAPSAAAAVAQPPPPHRPIDLNLKSTENLPPGAPGAVNSSVPHRISDQDATADPPDRAGAGDAGISNLEPRVLELTDKDMKFDIEEGNDEIGDVDSDPIIPGLSTNLRSDDFGGGGGGEGDDWDSDSDDDLQIVLNDNSHGPMGMERGGIEDDDEDGEALVIVADGDANQAMEEQDWGEEASQAADGERKEMGEAGKANGGMAMAPKVRLYLRQQEQHWSPAATDMVLRTGPDRQNRTGRTGRTGRTDNRSKIPVVVYKTGGLVKPIGWVGLCHGALKFKI